MDEVDRPAGSQMHRVVPEIVEERKLVVDARGGIERRRRRRQRVRRPWIRRSNQRRIKEIGCIGYGSQRPPRRVELRQGNGVYERRIGDGGLKSGIGEAERLCGAVRAAVFPGPEQNRQRGDDPSRYCFHCREPRFFLLASTDLRRLEATPPPKNMRTLLEIAEVFRCAMSDQLQS